MAGLVPPISAVFLAVMSSYDLRLAQLRPNAVLAMAIFQHFCETFVGVLPSVAQSRIWGSRSRRHHLLPQIWLNGPVHPYDQEQEVGRMAP